MTKIYLILILCFGGGLILAQQNSSAAVTICWDSSLSMQDRKLEDEFRFLEDYFSKNPEADVTLLLFSNTIVGKESFQVSSGRWGLIKERLLQVTYDGATSYSSLSELAGQGDILLFTDGKQNTNSSSPYFNGRLYVINSKKDFNRASLNLLTILNKGNLVNLIEVNSRSDAEVKQYFGTIQGSQIANRQVEISIKDRPESATRPEADGSYLLDAEEGDVMVVTAAGDIRIEKPLGTNKNIDIWLGGTDEIKLEEVIVTGVQEERAEEKVTAYGTKNIDAVGYAVQSISEEDIADITVTVNNATQGKFSGVSLGQNDDLSQVIMRPSLSLLGNNYGLIVIDGVPIAKSDSGVLLPAANSNVIEYPVSVQGTGFIDPQNIAKITVLKGLAATNRFGSLGANGVILITTKTGSFTDTNDQPIDMARLTDNIYEGKLNVSSKSLVTPYLKALKKAKNLEEAYNLYLEQRNNHQNESAYYIDIFDYFYPSSEPLAKRVLSNILEDDKASYSSLRAMLFKTQQHQMNTLELETALRILELFPQKIQSYFDLAMAYKANGEYQQCLEQLLKISDGTANGSLDFSGLNKSAETEIKNLVYQKVNKMNLTKLPAEYRKNLTFNARLAFDWNHSPAEFELQFVNPQKRFFNWEHTSLVNPDRIQDEIDQGFGREEFEIVGQETLGEWLINVTYKGNLNDSDKTPTFLRCRIQTQFGKKEQQDQLFTIRLHERDSKEQFIKLQVN